MKHKRNYQNALSNSIENLQPSAEWTHPNSQHEKSRSNTIFFTQTSGKPFSKKHVNTIKALQAKLHKLPLQPSEQHQNMLKISQVLPHNHSKTHLNNHSNIELLKKEIQYLEQNNSEHYQFPNQQPFFPSSIHTSTHQLTDTQHYCSKTTLYEIIKNDSKGFILAPHKSKSPSFQTPYQRKYLRSKTKTKKWNNQNESLQIKAGKTFSKFQLIAPYRRYFQSNRFHKNKSCTMKVDEIMGKRINKLTKFTFEEEET